jgi:integrase/recombinase XerD
MDSNGTKNDTVTGTISGTISIQEFINKQKDFMLAKKLEGLAERTMTDYVNHFQYVNNWVLQEYVDPTVTSDRYIEKTLFMGYTGYMISHFKPSTVNIRLRTLRCYLKWLYSEGMTKEDISTKLKLVKVPKDTIHPLSPQEVKKIFKVLDLSNYADYRDFCIMLVMLETGVRVNEASNIMLSEVNQKLKLLTVRSETSKTREERHLPISAKTMKYLEKLITIAKSNGELHLFNSTLGGRVATMTIIKNFDKYGKRAGIDHRCTPHVFRHIMAVNSVKAGMDIFTLQKLLGHSNITTTRQYIQLSTDDLISSHDKVNVISRFL